MFASLTLLQCGLPPRSKNLCSKLKKWLFGRGAVQLASAALLFVALIMVAPFGLGAYFFSEFFRSRLILAPKGQLSFLFSDKERRSMKSLWEWILNHIKSIFNILRGREKLTGRHLLLLSALFIFLAVCSVWSVIYTSSSSFCATCHEMVSFQESWQVSSHKNVACIECHGKPGLAGTIETKANGLRQAYLHLTKSRFDPKAPVNEVNCFSCHQDKVSTNLEQAVLRKDPHTWKHFANGNICLSCHTGVVHDLKINTAVPSRASCVTCHLDQMQL
jgi:trimethylamine-N-oxide reductase cytochrome c-type subunit TorC